MTNVSHRLALAAALALAALVPVARAEDAGPMPDSEWLLRGGFDVGRGHSRGVSAGVDYTGRSNATATDSRYWDAGGYFSRSQSNVESTTLRAGGETRTGAGGGYASYGNEGWRGVLGVDAAKDEDLRKSQRFSVGVDFARGGFAANLTASRRRTNFEDFTISPQAAALLGIPLASGAAVSCNITDKGVGAKLGYSGSAWGAYATTNSYNYDKASCSANFVLPEALRQLSDNDIFVLGGRFFDRARARTGGRIGAHSRLLKSEFGAGFSFAWGIQWAVDYMRSKEGFGEATFSDYSVTGTFRLASNVSMDLMLGSTSGDGGKAPYLGLMLAVAM